MLVGVPNPSPGNTIHIENAIQQALQEADRDGVRGNAVTPYVLARVKDLTGGQSLEANISLVKNNAAVASEIAIEYAPLAQAAHEEILRKKKATSLFFTPESNSLVPPAPSDTAPVVQNDTPHSDSALNSSPPLLSTRAVVVFGGAVVDQMMTPKHSQPLLLHTSNPGQISYTYGGVGRNIAEGLAQTQDGTSTFLVTAIGSDANGVNLLNDCKSKGINTSFITQSTSSLHQTAVYSAVHDHTGDLVVAIASMDIFQQLLTPDILKRQLHLQNILKSSCELVVIDGNISIELFSSISAFCSQHDIPIFFEPTSVPKCTLPISSHCLHHV